MNQYTLYAIILGLATTTAVFFALWIQAAIRLRKFEDTAEIDQYRVKAEAQARKFRNETSRLQSSCARLICEIEKRKNELKNYQEKLDVYQEMANAQSGFSNLKSEIEAYRNQLSNSDSLDDAMSEVDRFKSELDKLRSEMGVNGL